MTALPLPELAGVRHRFLDLSTRVRAHVAEAGPEDAPAVVCLHGWPQHWWMWRRVIPLLAGELRLLCPDLRAFGWSGLAGRRRLRQGADRRRRARPARRARPRARDGPRLGRLGRHPARAARAGARAGPARHGHPAPVAAAGPREPSAARATSALYRTFLVWEVGPGLIAQFGRQRLTVPARLLIGRRDPLGTAMAEGFERHGDDAAVELIDGCGHFVPEKRPELVAERARALFAY